MNISRKQSLFLGISTIVLFFAASVIMLRRNSALPTQEQITPIVEGPRASLAPTEVEAGVTLNDFQRSESRDGKLLWEVRATKGRYLPSGNEAILENATLHFFRKDGSQVELQAAKAELKLSGTALLRAEASQGVTLVYNEKTTITADAAIYNKENNSVEIPGEVRIDSDTMEISGRILNADLEQKVFVIQEDVSSMVKARARSK